MSEVSRHRPYLVWGAVCIALTLVLGVLLVPTDGFVALDVRRSSLRTTPDGVAGWARSLAALGVRVEQRYQDLVTTPPEGAVFVLLEPVVAPSAGEVHELLEWVRAGGTAIYSPRLDTDLSDSLGLHVDYDTREYDEPTATDTLLSHPWTEAPVSWETVSWSYLDADSARAGGWVPLSRFADTGLPSMAWLPEGEGGLLVVADAGIFANDRILDEPGAVTATRAVVDRAGSGTVWFSEYHQSIAASRGVLREALAIAWGLPFGRALLCIAFVGPILLVLGGRRFGRPLPEPPGRRRSTVEHVEALAAIYRASRAEGTTAHHLVRSALRRMNLPPSPLSDAELLSSWAARSDLREPALAAAAALAGNHPDLIGLESSLDDVVRRYHERLSPP